MRASELQIRASDPLSRSSVGNLHSLSRFPVILISATDRKNKRSRRGAVFSLLVSILPSRSQRRGGPSHPSWTYSPQASGHKHPLRADPLQQPRRARCAGKRAERLREESKHDPLSVKMVDLAVVESGLVVPCFQCVTKSQSRKEKKERAHSQVVKPVRRGKRSARLQ